MVEVREGGGGGRGGTEEEEEEVVWCGVVWCGVVWCGVVWCGVVWCGVVWCGVVWCGVVWCGVVWEGRRRREREGRGCGVVCLARSLTQVHVASGEGWSSGHQHMKQNSIKLGRWLTAAPLPTTATDNKMATRTKHLLPRNPKRMYTSVHSISTAKWQANPTRPSSSSDKLDWSLLPKWKFVRKHKNLHQALWRSSSLSLSDAGSCSHGAHTM